MVIGAEHRSYDMSKPRVSAGRGWLEMYDGTVTGGPVGWTGPMGSEHVSLASNPPSESPHVQMGRSWLITSQNEIGPDGDEAGEGEGVDMPELEPVDEEEPDVDEEEPDVDEEEPDVDELEVEVVVVVVVVSPPVEEPEAGQEDGLPMELLPQPA